MADIVLTGLATNDPVPGEYVEVAFAQGVPSLANGVDYVLLMGNILSTGSGAVNTLYGPDTPIPMTGIDDANLLFGESSELARLVSRFVKTNQTTPVYAIGVAEGGSATAATGTITVTGPATGNGTLRIYVDDEFCDVGFVTGDSATTIATNAVTQITAKSSWRASASNVAGVITLTTKQKGLRANSLRYFARVIPFTGTGVGVTPTTSTLATGGTVSDDVAAALAVVVARKFAYIVPAHVDATNLGKVLTQINTQAAPVTGIRQAMVAGSTDSLANSITIVDSLNSARSELIWQLEGDIPAGELAAHVCAAYMLYEAPSVPRLNFNFYGDADGEPWFVKPALSGSAPTRGQIAAALNAGLTPIASRSASSAYLVKRITTRYKTGAVLDYRIRDAHKRVVCDRYADSLVAGAALRFRGKEIGDDPKNNEPLAGPRVVTPRVVKAFLDGVTDVYAGNDLLQNVPTIKAQTQVLRDSQNRQRMGARVPLQPIDILDQLAAKVDQVA